MRSLIALTVVLSIPTVLFAADFTWDGGAASSDWSAKLQIAPGVFRNNWGQTGASPVGPGASDNVNFPINALVTGAGDASDVANSAVLTFGSGTLNVHGDAISNTDTLTFLGNNDNQISGPDDNYSINSSATLTGGGDVILVEQFESRITGDGTLTNADNTIRGEGRIEVATLVNEGTVRAEAGGLDVMDTVFTNTDGTVEIAADGILNLVGSTIVGGDVTGESGLLQSFLGGGWADLAFTGTVKQASSITVLSGTISNAGTLTFLGNNDSQINGPDDNYSINTSATLTGGGQVVLVEQLESRITGAGTLTNANNTIRGTGTIDVSALVNQGIVRATDGTLNVQKTAMSNVGGLVEITANGTLVLNGAIVTGGTFNGIDGGLLQGFTGGGLADLDVSGTVTQASSTTVLRGEISNAGKLTFLGNNDNQISGPDDNYSINTSATLTGRGEVVLVERFESRITGIGTLTNANNIIRGTGLIDTANLINNGSLLGSSGALPIDIDSHLSGSGTLGNVRIRGRHAPGTGIGVVPLEASYVLTGVSPQLGIEIGGLMAGAEHDQLASTGTVAVAGLLDLTVVNAGGGFYLPEVGDEITIVTAAGGVTGTFVNSASLSAVAGGSRVEWSIAYATNDVKLTVTAVTEQGIDGDYNGNGVVDAADYTVWRDALDGIDLAADGNRGGSIDLIDRGVWRANFGGTSVKGAGKIAVPEPATWIVAALLGLSLRLAPRGNR